MYTTCMFCNKPRGRNEVIESFPVGRRMAFDGARGRLWVVCTKCERWNLTPLEERWEAVEDCERIFRGTRVRISTENVGLARHRDGLTLVRIGRPLRPEFAAWRYGDQFGRRRRRRILYGAGAAVVVGGVMAGGAAAGVLGGAVISQSGTVSNLIRNLGGTVRFRTGGDEVIKLSRSELLTTRMLPSGSGSGFRVQIKKAWPRNKWNKVWFEGDDAHCLAAAIMPKLNSMGGTAQAVDEAVNRIGNAGHPERFLQRIVADNHKRFEDWKGIPGYIGKMPAPTRLGLEMALHEEQERRALEGELWLLERAWREADEIAEISDNLLLPEGTDAFIRSHGGSSSDPARQPGARKRPADSETASYSATDDQPVD